MPKLIRKKGSPFWHYDFQVNGVRIYGSTKTTERRAAERIIAKEHSDAVLNRHFKRKPRMTLSVATGRYFKEHGSTLPSAWDVIDPTICQLLGHFGDNIYLDEIGDAGISEFKSSLGVKPATVNRKLGVLSAILNRAKEQWGVGTPDIIFKKHYLRAPEARTRWITQDEADKLIMAAADHMKPIIRCALLTGLRRENIFSLQWEQVNIKERLIRVRVKSKLPGGKLLELPISDPMLTLLSELGPKKTGVVFVRKFKNTKGQDREPEPLRGYRSSFQQACKGAKIKDFRFHDLRHTAASWMIQKGVPLDVVQEILGHSHISQTQKYAHRQASDKMDALNALGLRRIHEKKSRRNASL